MNDCSVHLHLCWWIARGDGIAAPPVPVQPLPPPKTSGVGQDAATRCPPCHCQLVSLVVAFGGRGVLAVQHGVVDGGEHHLWGHDPREEL